MARHRRWSLGALAALLLVLAASMPASGANPFAVPEVAHAGDGPAAGLPAMSDAAFTLPGGMHGLVPASSPRVRPADLCLPPLCNPLDGVLSAINALGSAIGGIASAIAALPDQLFARVSDAFTTFLTGLENWITSQIGNWIAALVHAVAGKGLDLWHTLWDFVGAHIFGWIGALIDAVAAAISTYITTAAALLITVVTTTPQLLDPGSGLADLYSAFWTFAWAICGSLLVIEMLRGLALSLGATTLGPGLGGLRRYAVAVFVLQLLHPGAGLLHTWIAIVNGLAGGVTTAAAGSLASALAGYVALALKLFPLDGGVSVSVGLAIVLVVSAILAVLCALIVLQRIGGLFVLGGLLVVAPLAAVALISLEFRQFGRWWFSNFVSYSLWGFGYALVVCVIGELLVVGAPASGIPIGSALLYHFALPFAGLLVLLRVPRIMDSMLGAMSSRLIGATAAFDASASTTASAIHTVITHKVRQYLDEQQQRSNHARQP